MLVNSGDCDLVYEISRDDSSKLLDFDKPKGLLPARSNLKIVTTFKPPIRGSYNFEIVCLLKRADAEPIPELANKFSELDPSPSLKLWDNAAEDDNAGLDPPKIKCSVDGTAAYPIVAVEDARSPGISTARLWRQMKLTDLNRTFRTPLTEQ